MKYLRNLKFLMSVGLLLQIDQGWAYFDPEQLLDRLKEFEETPLPLLTQAVERGDLNEVKTVLKSSVDVNELDKHDLTALMRAVNNGRHDIVALLIEHGADPHFIAWNDETALREAVKKNDIKLIKQFLNVNSDFKKHSMGYALVEAAYQNNKKLVEIFIQAGADPNSYAWINPITSSTALIESAQNGNYDIVEILLNHGANRELCDTTFQMTALQVAQNKKYETIVRLLQRT